MKSIKNVFPNNFKENNLKEEKTVFLNAIKLYDGKSTIIRLFGNKYIEPSDYSHNKKSEPDEYDEVVESEQKSEESIGETVKLRGQEKPDENNV